MHPYPLDSEDRTLLNALQRDGRATVGDLAEAVSLSTSPCWRRVRALEEAGVIAGYHAHLHRQQGEVESDTASARSPTVARPSRCRALSRVRSTEASG